MRTVESSAGRLALLALSCLAVSAGGSGTRPAGDRLAAAEVRAAQEALAGLPTAVAHFRAGRYAQAAEGFERLREALPAARHRTSAAALLGLPGPGAYVRLLSSLETNHGLSLLRMRRYRQAAASLERAVELEPRSAPARRNLGVALLHLKRFAEARDQLAEAVRRGDGGERTLLHLGQATLAAGEPHGARPVLERASREGEAAGDLSAWGTHLEAERLLAEIDAGAGDLEAARDRLESILARTPGDPQPRYQLIRVLGRLHDEAAAEAHRRLFEESSARLAGIQAALAANPEQVAGLRWVAAAYADLGLDHLAEVHLLQLLARHPDDLDARSDLAGLRRRHTARSYEPSLDAP